jgi:hypothetical protein
MGGNMDALAPRPGHGIALIRIITGLTFFMHGIQKFNGGVRPGSGAWSLDRVIRDRRGNSTRLRPMA